MPMPLSGGGHLSRRAGDEQLVRRKGKAFQFAFATEAKELLPQNEEFLLDASHKGLRVLARNEEGLTAPVAVLREVYGAGLEVGPPRVRLIEGVQVKEPIMYVRISMWESFRNVVKRALQRRRGLYTRPTAFVLSGMMVLHGARAPGQRDRADAERGELAALYSFVFLLFAVTGAGALSLDGLKQRADRSALAAA